MGTAIGGHLCENCGYALWLGGGAPTRRRRGERDDLATYGCDGSVALSVHFSGCVYAFLAWGRCFAVQPHSQHSHTATQPQNLLCAALSRSSRPLGQ